MAIFDGKLLSFVISLIFFDYYFYPGECSGSLTPTLRGVREWTKDTNFGNANNWEGLVDVNCSSNIFSFPGWMDTTVVSWPSHFIGSQIILPSNGHFVFQTGVITLSDKGKSDGSCQRAREVKFRRTSKSDWFDPYNWAVTGTTHASGQNAIPHVERVPCQFDAAKFLPKSTFSINIPQNVSLGVFLLGEKSISYTDIAIMMTSPMGKLQWKKETEVDFNLTNMECKDDDDSCICDNYKSSVKQRICSLAQPQCPTLDEEECINPLIPHGFCCPICGFHIKIKHSGSLKLDLIATQLKFISPVPSSDNKALHVDYFVSRYSPRNAHIILVPATKDAVESGLNVLGRIMSILKSQSQIEDVTWTGSWSHISSDVDKWTSEGLGGRTITFLAMLLVITTILGIFCFVYYRKNGSYPPLTLPTIANIFPSNLSIRVPSMHMPNINMSLPGRRTSTSLGGRAFGFARFSNERVSTVNIERTAAVTLNADVDTTVERGELVDDTIQRIDSVSMLVEENKVTQVSPDPGYTNVTYDLVGVNDNNEMEMVDTDANKRIVPTNTVLSSDSDATISPPPPKPIRIGTGILELSAFNVVTPIEPVYSEVVDALHEDDTSAILIPDVNEE